MPISDDKKRLAVTVPRELLPAIKQAADSENRDVSNWVYTLILKALDEKGLKPPT